MKSFFSLACLLLWLVSCAVTSAAASRYKLVISADGLYRVTAAELKSVGVDPQKIDLATLQLFHGDREIAIRAQGEKDNFSFDFYAAPNDSAYSPFDVYWFQWGVTTGKRMQELTLPPATNAPAQSFEDTIDFSKPTLYIPEPGDPGASWFWQALTAPTTTTVTATLPASLPAPAHLRVILWGSTTAPVSPNHHLSVFFNNVRVADAQWDGQGAHPIDAAIPPAAVRSGENTVRLVAPGDTRAPADIVLLRSIQVTYQRRLALDAGQSALEFQTGGGAYRIDGFSSNAVDLYDITDPSAPIHAANVPADARTIAFSRNVDAPRRWLAVDAAPKAVTRITPMTNPNLQSSSRQADYIIITAPEFQDALQPLVQWRQDHGLKVAVVTTDEVYDEFNFGAASPLAIRALIDWAFRQWARPAPRFVLLVGKASYDYLNYLNGANPNLVPTYLVTTPHLGQAASDNWFVAPDDATGRPALAIGRIPAKTADQVARAVSKIIAYESASPVDWRHRAIFVADDKEPGFAQSADTLAAQTKMQLQKIYLAAYQSNVDTARADLIRDWNAGAGLVTYIGHGSIDTWAAGPLFSADHLGEITNGDRLPILFTPTCLDGFFYHPQVDSLTEDLLFKSNGGIVAGLVPTGLSLPQAQDAVMQNLFKELFDTPAATLGEAIMRAKQETPDDSSNTREVIDTFGLLGDPALRFETGN